MKELTLSFAKDYKRFLYSLNFAIVFLGILISFKIVEYHFISVAFPWISAPLVVIDFWISLCFLISLLVDGTQFSYKKIIGDFLLITTIFYNSIHVFLSLYFGTKFSTSWYFFYGCYHFILAFSLYFIFKNYKNREARHSAKTLETTGWIIVISSVVFLIIVHHVLREAEKIIIHNYYLIYSLAVIAIFNMILSLYFIIKYRKSTKSNFIAHKYINLVSAIFSIFFIQAIYLNEFCESLPVSKMQTITLAFGLPCFFALFFMGLYLINKAKYYSPNRR